jgi:hypothetical protein
MMYVHENKKQNPVTAGRSGEQGMLIKINGFLELLQNYKSQAEFLVKM